MNEQIGLLFEQQVFGEERIDVIKAIGTQCAPTDFAVLLGIPATEMGSRWFLASPAGYGDVCVVNDSGEKGVAYANIKAGIRPMLQCVNPESLGADTRKDISGFLEVDYGEYPQRAADKETARTLENEYQSGGLRKTGKTYEAIYDEYLFEDNKYIRAENLSGQDRQLRRNRCVCNTRNGTLLPPFTDRKELPASRCGSLRSPRKSIV